MDIVFIQLLSGQALQTSCCWQTPSSCANAFNTDGSSSTIAIKGIAWDIAYLGLASARRRLDLRPMMLPD